jgi:hypothetical protein
MVTAPLMSAEVQTAAVGLTSMMARFWQNSRVLSWPPQNIKNCLSSVAQPSVMKMVGDCKGADCARGNQSP